jgi:hypothetical protein
MVYVIRTGRPVLDEFAAEIKNLGHMDLYEMLKGRPIIEGIMEIADTVGFGRHPDDKERVDGYLNELWPYIVRYKKDEDSSDS